MRFRLFLVSCAIASFATPLVAQSSSSSDTITTTLASVASVAHDINAMLAANRGLQSRARELVNMFREHNAEQCQYLQNHPELCDNYDVERLQLVASSQRLQQEMKAMAARRDTLLGRFVALMTTLQTAPYPATIQPERDRIVACTRAVSPLDAAACLGEVRRAPGAAPAPDRHR